MKEQPLEPRTIEAHWPLGGVSIGRAYSTYPTRKVVTISADEGTFVAKLDRAPGHASDVARRLEVFGYLRDRGFEHVPVLLRTRDGERSVDLPGRTVYVMEFIPHPVGEDGGATLQAWWELGLAAARLNADTDYRFPYAVPVRAALEELDRWVDGRPFEREFRRLLDRVAELEDHTVTGLVHGEINTPNAGRRDDGTVVLLDWDEAGSGATALEYGYPLICAFVDEHTLAFDEEAAAAFFRGYSAEDGEIDRALLFPAALFHALRYLRFGDEDRRWRRILHAVEHESSLSSVVP